ncbi:MAG: ATP-binding protein [Candidatus Gracilibacteria bacterium]|nr:ATP-binding protein [Candidatus Gracilibacteria bacterium]
MKKTPNKKEIDINSFLSKYNTSNNSKNQTLSTNDFSSAYNDVYHIDTSDFSLKDIILPKKIEEEIRYMVYEQENKVFFEKFNLIPSNKVLFYGNPGCGKTRLSFILSSLLKRELKVVNLSRLISPHLGETSANISGIFNKYGNKDYILFIDEFDIIGRLRGDNNNEHNEMKRVVNSLLQLIDFLPSDAFLILATNDIDIIDKALIRRLDKSIEIPMPTTSNIKKYIKSKLKIFNDIVGEIDYSFLAKKYKGLSYSYIEKEIEDSLKKFLIEYKKGNLKKDNFITTEIFK